MPRSYGLEGACDYERGSLRNGQRSRYHKWRVALCHVKTEAGLWGGSLKRGGLGGEGYPSQ